MPRKTFLRLADVKRNAFITACLDEFSRNDYDTASISAIVRNLGIAKGSVYQYFEDKKDLWLYLRQLAEQERLRYLKEVYRSSFDDFYGYFAALQQKEVLFSRDHPLQSRFLFRAVTLETSSTLQQEVEAWKQQQLRFYEKLVEAEKLIGSLDASLRNRTAAMFLQSVSHTLREYLTRVSMGDQIVAQVSKKEDRTVIDRIKGVFSSGTPDPYEEAETLISELMTMVRKALVG